MILPCLAAFTLANERGADTAVGVAWTFNQWLTTSAGELSQSRLFAGYWAEGEGSGRKSTSVVAFAAFCLSEFACSGWLKSEHSGFVPLAFQRVKLTLIFLPCSKNIYVPPKLRELFDAPKRFRSPIASDESKRRGPD